MRVILAIAEAPAFPASSKATSYWFPLKERGLATSSFEAAAKFSNLVGVPLVALAITLWGWRGGFLLCYRHSRETKLNNTIAEPEYAYITTGGAQDEGAVARSQLANLGYLLSKRKVWGLTLSFGTCNYAFYRFLTWLPGYLQTQLHMTVLKSGWYTAIPWIVATIADFVIGGWLVDALIRKGYHHSKVRLTLLMLGMLLGRAVLGVAFTRHPNVAIFWISVALGGLAFSAPIGWSIPALIAPEGSVGTLGGIFNCISGLCSLPAPIITGYIVQTTGSFASAFIAGGIVLVVGIFCYVVLYILFPSENDMLIVLCNVLASQLSDSKISSLSGKSIRGCVQRFNDQLEISFLSRSPRVFRVA